MWYVHVCVSLCVCVCVCQSAMWSSSTYVRYDMSSVLWRHNFWTFAQRPVSEGVLGIIVCLYNPRGIVVTKCTVYCHLTYCLLSPDLLLTVTDLLLTVTDLLRIVT